MSAAVGKELGTSCLHLAASLVEVELGAKTKEELGDEIGTLVALLEVYTDQNYGEEEQGRIFQGAGHKIELLKATPEPPKVEPVNDTP